MEWAHTVARMERQEIHTEFYCENSFKSGHIEEWEGGGRVT